MEDAEGYLAVSYVTQMPALSGTRFKQAFKNKGREKSEKTNEQVEFNLVTYVPNGTEISKKEFWYILKNDFIIARQELKDCPDAIGKIET